MKTRAGGHDQKPSVSKQMVTYNSIIREVLPQVSVWKLAPVPGGRRAGLPDGMSQPQAKCTTGSQT